MAACLRQTHVSAVHHSLRVSASCYSSPAAPAAAAAAVIMTLWCAYIGELHNNIRMTWGKAILPWSPDPDTAIKRTVYLNHKYALDGCDPCSYSGILWCYGVLSVLSCMPCCCCYHICKWCCCNFILPAASASWVQALLLMHLLLSMCCCFCCLYCACLCSCKESLHDSPD